MWLNKYICVPCSRALLSTPWLQIRLYFHSSRSKPRDCLFCVCTDGSIKRTLAELQVRPAAYLDKQVTWDTRLCIRPTSSSVFLTRRCRFEQGSLPIVPIPGERVPVLLEEAVFNSQRLLEWSCASVHPTPQWPTVSRTACTRAALCLTPAACAGMEWLHWPLGSSYNKWLWVTAEFARKNRAAYTIEFGLSCREVKPLQPHTD